MSVDRLRSVLRRFGALWQLMGACVFDYDPDAVKSDAKAARRLKHQLFKVEEASLHFCNECQEWYKETSDHVEFLEQQALKTKK